MTEQEVIKQSIEQVLKAYPKVELADIQEDKSGVTVYLRLSGLKIPERRFNMWRPEELNSESIVIAVYQELTTESTDETERKLVEAGADAMLEALRKRAVLPNYVDRRAGILVFIPDEEG